MQKQTTVMVVDDEETIRTLISRVLAEQGYGVIKAENGRVALNLLNDHLPDLILLDMKMPELTGIELLTALKGRPSLPPIIVLTGLKDEELVEKAFALGAVDYVTKPFMPNVLLARIKAKLRRFGSNETL